MNLRSVIIEDELHSQETLKNMIAEFCENVSVEGVAANVSGAVELIRTIRPDLVFLDIELKSGTGFDVLEKIQGMNFHVIFTTAYEHYALQAIKVSSIDYLLKPIDIDELTAALEKVRHVKFLNEQHRQWKLLLETVNGTNKSGKICLSTAEGMDFIEMQDIIYAEANGAYTRFVISDHKDILVSKNLKEYELMLNPAMFMRIHNSFLINLNQVGKYIKSEGGYVLMANGHQVSISPKKRDEFLLRMTGSIT